MVWPVTYIPKPSTESPTTTINEPGGKRSIPTLGESSVGPAKAGYEQNPFTWGPLNPSSSD